MSMKTTTRAMNWISRLIAAVGLFALLGLALMVMAEVLSRWLLGTAFQGSHDIMQLALPVIVAATFPAAMIRRQHITITFLGGRLGNTAAHYLDLLGNFVLFAVMAVITWQLSIYSMDVTRLGESSWILNVPLAPTWWVTASLFGVATLCQAVILVTDMSGISESEVSPLTNATTTGSAKR